MVRTRATKIIEGDVRYLCSGCGEYKKREEFSIDNRTKNGLQSKCKECNLKYRTTHKLQERIRNVKYRHDFTEEEAIAYINSPDFRELRKPKNINGEILFKCNKCKNFYPKTKFRLTPSGFPKSRCNKCNTLYNQNYGDKKSEQYGYNLGTFHNRALKFKIKQGIEFGGCAICKCAGPLQLHHPSYETEDMWEYIVPLCPSCHSKVHKQGMPCPPPIKLTDLVKQKKGGDDLRKNIRTLPNRPTTMKNISVGKSPKVNEKKSSDKDKQ